MFIYIHKQQENFQKARQFALRFYSQEARHFTLRNFHESFEIGIYIYTRRMTLCVMWGFYIQNARHFAKIKIICVLSFYIQKSLTLCVTRFSWNSWNWRRGGSFLWIRNNALCVKFLYAKKTVPFLLRFYIKKVKHFAPHFYMQKTIHFASRFFIYKIYRIVLHFWKVWPHFQGPCISSTIIREISNLVIEF